MSLTATTWLATAISGLIVVKTVCGANLVRCSLGSVTYWAGHLGVRQPLLKKIATPSLREVQHLLRPRRLLPHAMTLLVVMVRVIRLNSKIVYRITTR